MTRLALIAAALVPPPSWAGGTGRCGITPSRSPARQGSPNFDLPSRGRLHQAVGRPYTRRPLPRGEVTQPCGDKRRRMG